LNSNEARGSDSVLPEIDESKADVVGSWPVNQLGHFHQGNRHGMGTFERCLGLKLIAASVENQRPVSTIKDIVLRTEDDTLKEGNVRLDRLVSLDPTHSGHVKKREVSRVVGLQYETE